MHIPKLLVIFVIYASSIGYLCSCDARPASGCERSKDPRVHSKRSNIPSQVSEGKTCQTTVSLNHFSFHHGVPHQHLQVISNKMRRCDSSFPVRIGLPHS